MKSNSACNVTFNIYRDQSRISNAPLSNIKKNKKQKRALHYTKLPFISQKIAKITKQINFVKSLQSHRTGWGQNQHSLHNFAEVIFLGWLSLLLIFPVSSFFPRIVQLTSYLISLRLKKKCMRANHYYWCGWIGLSRAVLFFHAFQFLIGKNCCGEYSVALSKLPNFPSCCHGFFHLIWLLDNWILIVSPVVCQ